MDRRAEQHARADGARLVDDAAQIPRPELRRLQTDAGHALRRQQTVPLGLAMPFSLYLSS